MGFSTFETFKHLPINDGFVVLSGEILEKYQHILCEMAKDIIDVCEENHIYYQLSGGTALGAVRHGGFIPWDDDIDLNILSSDLFRLKKCINAKFGKKYTVQTYNDTDYGIIPSKIRLTNSIARGREDVNAKECGITIDVFAIENTYNNAILRALHGVTCMGFGFLLSCRNFYKNRAFLRRISASDLKIKRIFNTKIIFGFFLSFMSVKRWAIITNHWYGLCKNNRSQFVTIPSGRKHFFGELYRRKGMISTIKIPFEGNLWNVAKDYDSYFKRLYGSDYMTLPPKNKRESHVLLELKFPEEMSNLGGNYR